MIANNGYSMSQRVNKLEKIKALLTKSHILFKGEPKKYVMEIRAIEILKITDDIELIAQIIDSWNHNASLNDGKPIEFSNFCKIYKTFKKRDVVSNVNYCSICNGQDVVFIAEKNRPNDATATACSCYHRKSFDDEYANIKNTLDMNNYWAKKGCVLC